MKFWYSLLAIPLVLGSIASTHAAESSVQNVSGRIENNQLIVSWDPPAEAENVVSYRVYYASQSLVESDGAYDDFEIIDAKTHEYVFTTIPNGEHLFVSVIPVDDKGEELDSFASEIEIPLENGSADPAISSAGPGEVVQIKATADKVIAQLSANVVVAAEDAAKAFEITTVGGTAVQLRRLTLLGDVVTIDTMPLVEGSEYVLHVQEVVRTEQGESFGPIQKSFTIATPAAPTNTVTAAVVQSTESEVRNLQLDFESEADGRYLVTASWGKPSPDVQGYMIAQTYDDGRHFTREIEIPAETMIARFPRVWGGSVGLRIRTIAADGTISKGVGKAIILPSSTKRGNALNNSGAGATMALCTAAGGIAGAWYWRRRQLSVA